MFLNLKKKSQASVEFLLILIFVLGLISSLMYVVGIYSIDLKKAEREAIVQNFVDSILVENQIMSKVEGGYYRELEIPGYLTSRYNLSIINNYLVVIDLDVVDTTLNGSELLKFANFYELPEKGVTYNYNTTTGIGTFIFKKEKIIDYSDVIIIN